jgi:hypothetical protein
MMKNIQDSLNKENQNVGSNSDLEEELKSLKTKLSDSETLNDRLKQVN